MAKFKFRLDSILRLKEEQKGQIEMELAAVRSRKIVAEEELNAIIREKKRISEQINFKKSRQVLDFQADYYYIEALEKDVQNCRKKIQKIQDIENKVLNEILNLDRERKTMERLKEKHKTAFIREENRLEQNFLDDLSQRIKTKI